jgi:hypothetical protein
MSTLEYKGKKVLVDENGYLDNRMYSEAELCERITSLYPDVGVCGKDINVTYDWSEKSWLVHLEKGSHSLSHFLELRDADKCMEGRQCLALGLEIAQLRKNIEGEQF